MNLNSTIQNNPNLFCFPLTKESLAMGNRSRRESRASKSYQNRSYEMEYEGYIFKIGNKKVVGWSDSEIAVEWLDFFLKRGMEGLNEVIGEYVVCIRVDETLMAYRSITSGYRLYYSDRLVSNRLMPLYQESPTGEFDQEYVYHFLLRKNFLPHQFRKTPFAGISQLPAGHFLTIRPNGEVSVKFVEHPSLKAEAPIGKNRQEVAEQLREVMVEVVTDRAKHFSRNKKIVCEVSGGLDSSFVASIIGSHFKKVSAYMFSFPESPSHRSSEEYAKAVADAHGLDFQILSPDTFFPFDLSDPLPYGDEPSAYLWQGALFWKKIPQLIGGQSAIFSGVGSDQLFMRTAIILNWLLKQGRIKNFQRMIGQCSRNMERSAVSLWYQSALSLIPSKVFAKAMPALRFLPRNLLSFEEVMAFHISDSIAWLKGSHAKHYRILDLEEQEHRQLFGRTAKIRAPLASLMGPPISSVPMLEPHGMNYDLPFYDWRLMSFVYESVGWDLVHDWQNPYKHLLRESQKGIVPELTRTRQKNEFHFEGFLGKMVIQNENYIRHLVQNHPLKQLDFIDDKLLTQSLEVNLFCSKVNSDNRAFFNLLGFLLWFDNFKRHASRS